MKPRLKSTRAARELIKAYEPFHGEAVRRGRRWIVGWGHSAAAKAGVTVKPEDAELLLIYDVLTAEQAVHAALGEDIPAPMRDALVSFAASVGINAFKVSDVARLARSGRTEDAAAALETWVRAEEDGKLVTSERLVKRRAAEKALFLKAFDTGVVSPPAAEPAPAPAADPEPRPEPAPDTQAEPQPEPKPEAQDGEPVLGPLVEVELSFEEPDEDEDEDEKEGAGAPSIDDSAAPVSVETVEAESEAAAPAPVSEAAPEPETVGAPDVEAADADPEAPAEPDADAAAEAIDPESAPEAALEPAVEAPSESEPAFDPAEVKAAQDAAIAAVMTRMAGEIARSVSVAGVNAPQQAPEPVGPQPEPAQAEEAPVAPEPDLSGYQLGYSFLTPATVGYMTEPEPAAEAQPETAAELDAEPNAAPDTQPVAAPDAGEAASGSFDAAPEDGEPAVAPNAETGVDAEPVSEPVAPEAAGEAEGPGAPGSPRKPAPAAIAPVYASVSVSSVSTAPPHPAEAPAAAPGLSGESAGPDHEDEDEHVEPGEDEADLEPAIVAGAEATYIADEAPPAAVEGRGDWVYTANLLVGVGLIGFGAWEIFSNLDAYLAAGFDYSFLGPVALGSGVLLSVASGWFVLGHALKKD